MHGPLQACPGRRRQRGAALLLAMIVLTLVATLAAAMVSQQDRAIRVEGAERAREQVEAVSSGALQIARMLLREDVVKARTDTTDHLGETWARPLPETEVSTLISSDERSPTDREGLRAFISGRIDDANARFNLRNLIDDGNAFEIAPEPLAALQRLCETAGLAASVADRIAAGFHLALKAQLDGATLMPTRLEQLAWFDIDPATIEQLRPFVVLLPARSKLNINTASADVLAAVVPGMTTGQAAWITANRPDNRTARSITKGLTVASLRSNTQFESILKAKAAAFDDLLDTSEFYFASAQLRIGAVVAEERWLLRRDTNRRVAIIDHERLPAGTLQLDR